MQGNGADVPLVQVLVHLEEIRLVIQARPQGLAQRRQLTAVDHDHGALHLGDGAYGSLGIRL